MSASLGIRKPSYMSLVVMPLVRGSSLSGATGFIATHAGRAYLVTNWHVVSGRHPETNKTLLASAAIPDELAVLHLQSSGAELSWAWRNERLYDDDGSPLWLEHPHHGQGVDVIALPLADTEELELHPYDVTDPASSIAHGPSDQASIIGFPFGRTGGGALGIWVQGTIATEPSVDHDELPQLLIDSRTRPGQSGSPVILYRPNGYTTENGSIVNNGVPALQFLGVYSGRIHEQSDLGKVWKAVALRDILAAGERGALPRPVRS
jgi:hypothetical protein